MCRMMSSKLLILIGGRETVHFECIYRPNVNCVIVLCTLAYFKTNIHTNNKKKTDLKGTFCTIICCTISVLILFLLENMIHKVKSSIEES